MNRFLILLSLSCFLAVSCAKEPRVGAYSSVAVGDPEVQAAATFAIRAQAKAMTAASSSPKQVAVELVKVVRSQRQIVAGQNFQLLLKVKVNGQPKTAEAVVWWQPWAKPEPYQLTAWQWK